MGLDWCVVNKPKPGHEGEFEQFGKKGDAFDVSRQRYEEISISPCDTLGAPHVNVDDAATRYFLERTVPSRREANRKMVQEGTREADHPDVIHWQQQDELLIRQHYGDCVMELVDKYDVSTLEGDPPFTAPAHALMFRGKAIGFSLLLQEHLQNEAFQDMDPRQMADYAERLERAAIENAIYTFPFLRPILNNGDDAREWANQMREEFERRMEEADYHFDEFQGYINEAGEKIEENPIERLAVQVRVILDAARWLRFWADLGHGMYAWY